MEKELMAMCGAYCGVCEWKEPYHCGGCKSCQSKMFWGQCAIAKCCIDNGYEHCGLCQKMPCQKLKELFSDKEHGDSGARRNNLCNWANGKFVYEKLR